MKYFCFFRLPTDLDDIDITFFAYFSLNGMEIKSDILVGTNYTIIDYLDSQHHSPHTFDDILDNTPKEQVVEINSTGSLISDDSSK